ncbi:MAG TPA: shikimate kinase [Chthoniobacterales bacterium]
MNQSARSIVLIGFMGTGKSSVGELLAERLDWPLFDIDSMIEKKLKMPIGEIFSALGEEYFRDEESDILQRLMPTRSVIVTGGGMVLRRSNVVRLRELGTVVCLTSDVIDLQKRLLHQSDRPLLEVKDPRQAIEQLLEKRAPLYRAAADLTIDTSSLSPDQVADSILDALAIAN